MSKTISLSYSLAKEYRQYLSALLMAASMVMILIYTFNIYTIISHTVAMKRVQQQTVQIGTSVQELDGKYLEIAGNITPDILEAHGFAQAEVSEYISRPASISRVQPSQKGAGLSGYEL